MRELGLLNRSARWARGCRTAVLLVAAVGLANSVCSPCSAQLGTLAEPFPAATPNAALHYHRAMLQLGKLEPGQTSLVDLPLWQSLPEIAAGEVSAELASLLYRGRFAIRAATKGTRTSDCDFGIDFAEQGAATQLPHLEGMLRLGRLLTLRGSLAESRGDWQEAIIVYFDGLRMGRHLTHQSTLLETLTGLEILRNNYWAIARWSTRCPSSKLVARAFGLLEAMQASLVNPAQVVAKEGSILALGFDQLRQQYPDGNWAELILAAHGESPTGKIAEDRAAAKKDCIARGVPAEVFDEIGQFEDYVARLSATTNRYIEAVSTCVTLSASARLERGEALMKKYAKLIPLLGSDTMLNPVELGILFTEHEAELTVLRHVLAVSASKRDGKYPESLDKIAKRFGGRRPVSPYDGAAIQYESTASGFAIEVPAHDRFARVAFTSSPPIPPVE